MKTIFNLNPIRPVSQLIKSNDNNSVTSKKVSMMEAEYNTDSKPLITQFREGNRLMRTTASIVLCCFAAMFYSPAVSATVRAIDDYLTYEPDYPVFDEMEAALANTQQLLKQLNQLLITTEVLSATTDPVLNRQRLQAEKTSQQRIAALQKAIKEQRDSFDGLDVDANDYYDDQRSYYTKQQLPEKTITSLEQKQQRYQREMSTLQDQLQRLSNASDSASLRQEARLTTALIDRLYNPVHHPYDQTMPFGPWEQIAGAPMQDAAALQSFLGTAPLTGAPSVSDTAATIDAQLTSAIQAQAAALNNDPVEIYNWVYNNIEFIPSYGSLQGADYAMQTLRGNAFDQASVLIALLRAANIPARYVYGTMVVTNEEAMNWVGGVREPEAVQNLMSQGGIPVARLAINDKNDFITLEHVWVQLWDGSQWIEVDPSFKQYEYTEGMDLQSTVSFDTEAFANTLQSTSVANETEGWVQNVNQAFIETELDDYRQAVEDYLTTQQPDATAGDVIGSKVIIERDATELPSALLYERVIVSQAITEVPDDLRYKFVFELQDTFDNPLLTHTMNTMDVAGQALAVSFNPATEADQDVFFSLLPQEPQPGEGLPHIIQAGLFDVVGEFTVDGQVIASSAAMRFGQVLRTKKGYYIPGRGWSTTVNPIITGEYQAIGLDYQGVSPQQMETLRANLEVTKAKLEAADFDGMTKHQVVGDLLQSAVMSYLAMTDVQSRLSAQSNDMVYYREPSYGTFQTNAKTNGILDTVANVEMTGLLMDMDSMRFSTECKSNCWGNWKSFNQNLGSTYSAFEHLIPEQLFSGDEALVEGISAVKALAVALQKGQRIYTFDENNLGYLADLTIEQAIKDEISAAVAEGRVATVHQGSINYAGWSGVGYTIVDPETGAGSYKISGGANGGEVSFEDQVGAGIGLQGAIVGEFEKLIEKGALDYVIDHAVDWLVGKMQVTKLLGDLIENWQFMLDDPSSTLDIVQREYLSFALAGVKTAKAIIELDSEIVLAPQKLMAASMAISLYVVPYIGALMTSLRN